MDTYPHALYVLGGGDESVRRMLVAGRRRRESTAGCGGPLVARTPGPRPRIRRPSVALDSSPILLRTKSTLCPSIMGSDWIRIPVNYKNWSSDCFLNESKN